jgi:hypothetical protein
MEVQVVRQVVQVLLVLMVEPQTLPEVVEHLVVVLHQVTQLVMVVLVV